MTTQAPPPVSSSSPYQPLKSRNPDLKPLPTPFDASDYGDGREPYTLVEQNLMKALGAIKDKPDWITKIQNPDIVAKWRQEMVGQLAHPSQIDYVLSELTDVAKQVAASATASTISGAKSIPAAVDGVYQSDTAFSEELRQELLQRIRPLETVSENRKDWHPGSNEQVLDLVHPSLYCYVKGVTREINENNDSAKTTNADWSNFIGGGVVTNRGLVPPSKSRYSPKYNHSGKFQWLPSEVSVSKDGSCKFDSYINNLHPIVHKDLYTSLEKSLSCMIPLFSAVLTQMQTPMDRRHTQDMYELYEPQPNFEDEDDEDAAWDAWYENRVPNIQEEVPPYSPIEEADAAKTIDLNGRKLQVIVKLASIHLSNDKDDDDDNSESKSRYNGGVWHVEGMHNENIVASGIYYLQNENITESRLQFRTDVCEPPYEQGDDNGVEAVYGLRNEEPLVQTMGSVTCRQGRAVAWPNTLQHKVLPFELDEPMVGQGVRKILVFFLVDPAVRILSTAMVPPQQQEWMEYELKHNKPIPALPSDVQGLIVGQNWHFTHDMALQYRKELMEERKYFVNQNTQDRFERQFSLCEH